LSDLKPLLRRGLAPALLVIVIALASGAIGYLTAGSGDPTPPPAAAVERPFLRGVLQSLSGDRLIISTESGPVELRLAANAPIETLRPATIDRLSAGDWLNAGAVGHAQTLFALVGIVVIAPAQLESPR